MSKKKDEQLSTFNLIIAVIIGVVVGQVFVLAFLTLLNLIKIFLDL